MSRTVKTPSTMEDLYKKVELAGIPEIPGLTYSQNDNTEYVIVRGNPIDIWKLRDLLAISFTEYFETHRVPPCVRENSSLRFVDDKKSGLTAVTGRKIELNKLRMQIA